MPSLIMAGLLAAVFGILGFLTWLVLRIFGIRRGGQISKIALLTWLVSIPLFFFLAAPVLTSNLLFNSGTRPMDLDLAETPQSYQRPYQDVRFPSRDGIELSGWFLDGSPDRPAIVLSHGLFRNRHEMLPRACDLNRQGYPVLLFDFRAHGSRQGRSGPSGVTLGFQERLDVQGAVDYLRSQRSNPEVVLLGVSMGAVACILAAPQIEPPVSAIIADSPFQNLHETVSRHVRMFLKLPSFPFANVFSWNLARLAGFEADQHDSIAALQKIPQVPVLLIYGRDDSRMPEETAQAVYRGVSCARKDLAFFEDAGHGGAYEEHPERFIQTVLNFLNPRSDSRLD